MIPLPLRAALSLALLATLIGSPAAGSQRPRSAEAIGTVAFDCSEGIPAMVGPGGSLNDNLYMDVLTVTILF